MSINQVTHQKYITYMHADMCRQLPKLGHEQLDRSFFELIIVCNAFATQQVQLNLEFVPTPSYLRGVRMVEQGTVDTHSASIWYSDINQSQLYASEEVLRTGEFEKGIYVHESHPLLILPPDKINLSHYTALSVKAWRHDWAVSQSIAQSVADTGHMPAIFEMLAAKRADFTLLEFSNHTSMDRVQNDIRLKILTGLKQLRAKGLIYPVYVKAGFINPKVKHWRVVNPLAIASIKAN
ncbi:hypothetical protein [Saccharobesus litoralis]|uniref:hypothetical protein n=1 Tax=Saccharobesus litoralis TaxID=2172099 RepID=UPI00131F0D9C|nr:hypothetical protein [Saccharobesus litoralis]